MKIEGTSCDMNSFFRSMLSSNDDRVELKCNTSELRSTCSKSEKTAVI